MCKMFVFESFFLPVFALSHIEFQIECDAKDHVYTRPFGELLLPLFKITFIKTSKRDKERKQSTPAPMCTHTVHALKYNERLNFDRS